MCRPSGQAALDPALRKPLLRGAPAWTCPSRDLRLGRRTIYRGRLTAAFAFGPSRYRTLPAFARRQVAAGPSARFRSCLSAAKARWSHTRIFGHSYPIRAGPLLMTASHRGQQNSPPDLPSERSDTPHAFLRRPTRALTSRPAASRYIGHTFAASTITTAAPVSGLFTKHRRRFW
jgi:hypothetical protein